MLRFKEGVSIYGLQPEMLWALDRCVEIWEVTKKHTTVTCARGDRHKKRSRHYCGYAFDLRRHDLTPAKIILIMKELKLVLIDFDIVLESTHIHVEYDPKHKIEYMTERNF